jgi:SAM-dependent methyltransferase
VLDVAAGAGEQTLTIARCVGPGGSVLATDLSPQILALATENALLAGLDNVRVKVADGEDLGVDPAGFDAAVCRLGLMLFNDPMRGLLQMHRALRPGGRLCTMVFSSPQANPCITMVMGVAIRHAGLAAPDASAPGSLFSLGSPRRIDELFATAGFRDVATIALDAPFRLPSAQAYLDFICSAAGPIRQLLNRLGTSAAQAAKDEMLARLSAFATPTGWEGPNELLLTAGSK